MTPGDTAFTRSGASSSANTRAAASKPALRAASPVVPGRVARAEMAEMKVMLPSRRR